MRTQVIVLTGVLGWLGGLGTMAFSSSCDLVPCEPDGRASVVLSFSADDGSSAPAGVHATEVTYTVRETGVDSGEMTNRPPVNEATCINEPCSKWQLGFDQAGIFDIEATVCGETYTAQVEVEVDEDGCNVDTEYLDIQVDPTRCDPPPMEDVERRTCDLVAHPSVHVYVARQYGDYFATAQVDRVWYDLETRDGEVVTDEAYCIAGPDGDCQGWVAGWEAEGSFTLHTEYCDTVVSETVGVGMTADGCHVDTKFVMLQVDTRGCMTNDAPAQPPLPPRPQPQQERG